MAKKSKIAKNDQRKVIAARYVERRRAHLLPPVGAGKPGEYAQPVAHLSRERRQPGIVELSVVRGASCREQPRDLVEHS